MARIVYRSRRILLGTAFLAVMAGAGALLGAVAGVVLALLGRSVLNIGSGTLEFIAAIILLGAGMAVAIGLFLTAGQSLRVLSHTRFGLAASSVTVANAAVAPTSEGK